MANGSSHGASASINLNAQTIQSIVTHEEIAKLLASTSSSVNLSASSAVKLGQSALASLGASALAQMVVSALSKLPASANVSFSASAFANLSQSAVASVSSANINLIGKAEDIISFMSLTKQVVQKSSPLQGDEQAF